MKRQKKRYRIKIFKFIIIQLFLICIVIVCSKSLICDIYPHQLDTDTVPSKTDFVNNDTAANHLTITGNDLFSKNAILVRLKDKKILLDKHSRKIIYPASLTKIMTALVAIDNLDDLNQKITLSPDMFQSLYHEDASMAGFLPNEKVSAKDLIYGVLLPSGAECCLGLSDYIAGSENDFVTLMNEKADALGMSHTHFTNATGLNNPEHYTTAKDLATLLEYALQNDTFRKVFTSSRHTTSATNLHPNGISFQSTMFSKLASPKFDNGSFLGGKTGFTSEAGLCLASLAKIRGKEYILITAGANGNHKTKQYNIEDAITVYRNLY